MNSTPSTVVFEELSKHGDVEELHVCDNLSDHMIGNVYAKFSTEEQAAAAKIALKGRFYPERPIVVDFSPVTDFREASRRQYEERSCQKGGYCNFLHLKRVLRELRRQLYGRRGRSSDCRRSDRTRRLERRRSRSRSRSPPSNSYSKKGRGGREGSVERRAKIELWNREREELQGTAAAAAGSEHA